MTKFYKHKKTGITYRLDDIFHSDHGGDFLVEINGNGRTFISFNWLEPLY